MDIGLVNDDLDIEQGDFANVESTLQHQRQLLINNKGTFKENPTICIGLWNYIDDENFSEAMAAVRTEFPRDRMQINSISITAGNININAYYP